MKKIYRKNSGQNKMRTAEGFMLLIFVLVLASCSLSPQSLTTQPEARPQQEALVPVTRGAISESMSFVGNLRYKQSSELVWKTNGVVEKVYVKVGDRVNKDDILAELDPDFLSSTVLIAEKNMIDGQVNLEDVLGSESPRMQAYVDLNVKESALIKAKLEQEALYYPRATRYDMERAWDDFALANLNFNYAKQDYDHLVSIGEGWEGFEEGREVRMFGGRKVIIGKDSRSARERKFEDYVSTYNELVSAYEKYVWVSGKPSATDYAVAEGNVQVAQKEYEKALETYRSYEILPRDKDVQAAEISLNNAETIYKQRYIYAPFDGVVTAVDAVESYYITRGTKAVRIDDMSGIYIPLSISELDLSLVSTGTPVKITVDAFEGKTYDGHIADISEASTASGNVTTFNALVVFDTPESGLLAGMTAEVSVLTKEKSNALLIPSEAVTFTEGKPAVTVVNGSERQTIEITTGIVTGNIMEVVSDNLHEGDRLAVTGISADSLRKLGLDPADYITDRPQGPDGALGRNDHGGSSDAAPARKPDQAAVPTGTSAPDTENTEVPGEVIETDDNSAEEKIPDRIPDGQFPIGPGNNSGKGPRPEGTENRSGEGRTGDQQRPEGGRDGQFQRNKTPQPTMTVESSGKG